MRPGLGLLLAGLLFAQPAWADLEVRRGQPAVDGDATLGLGVVLGDPTALSLKGMLSGNDAVQIHAGWRLGDPDGGRMTLVVDYLRHFVVVNPAPTSGALSPYIGVGGKVAVGDGGTVLGPRVPLGLSYYFGGVPIELALEVAPGLAVLPGTGFMIDGGLAARYYF